MKAADRDRPFIRQRDRHEALVARFDQHLKAYHRKHPDADEGELTAYTECLLATVPGLKEAFAYRGLRGEVTAVLIADRGDSLPLSGPSTERDADGERLWKQLDKWTLDDYRLNLAWYREPGAPPTRLAALVTYGATRWPRKDLACQSWPDISDLPSWQKLASYLYKTSGYSRDTRKHRTYQTASQQILLANSEAPNLG